MPQYRTYAQTQDIKKPVGLTPTGFLTKLERSQLS